MLTKRQPTDSNYDWVLKKMNGMASDAPRSEFLTADASMKAKFQHSGARACALPRR